MQSLPQMLFPNEKQTTRPGNKYAQRFCRRSFCQVGELALKLPGFVTRPGLLWVATVQAPQLQPGTRRKPPNCALSPRRFFWRSMGIRFCFCRLMKTLWATPLKGVCGRDGTGLGAFLFFVPCRGRSLLLCGRGYIYICNAFG